MNGSQNALRLKRLREFLGYSQRELAQEFQVTSGAVAHWESGLRAIPGPVEKLISIYEESLNLQHNTEARISEEALRQSRDLLKEILKALSEDGVIVRDSEKKKLLQLANDYFSEDLARFRVGGMIKSALIKKLVRSLAGSQGLSIKAAQMASFLEMGLPPEVSNILGDLQLSGKPMPYARIQGILDKEYAGKKVFASVKSTPLAVTSIAQLHRATLIGGGEVVVKVQNPDIGELLKGQFKKLSFLVNLGALLGARVQEALDEIQSQVFLELDYAREVHNQERFRNIFEHEPRIVIPRIHRDLCRSNIIVSEYQSGLDFKTFVARAKPIEKSRAAELIAYFHSYAIFHRGLLHGDAHPENFLFRDNNVIFLDFGRIMEFEAEDLEKERLLYQAILYGNKSKFLDHFIQNALIFDPGNFDFDAFWMLIQRQNHHHLVDSPFKITRSYLRSNLLEAKQFKHRKMIRMNKSMLRASLVNASLWSLFADLEAEVHWRGQALEILNKH